MSPAPLGDGPGAGGVIGDTGPSDFSFASSFVSAQLAQLAMTGLKPQPLSVVCPNIIESEDAITAKVPTRVHHLLLADRLSVREDGTESGDVTDDATDDATDAEDDATDDDEADDDDALPVVEPVVAQTVFNHSQKKRADYDAFDSWLAQNRESITKTTKMVAVALCDEDKTAATLVREFESAKIIESPRDYQIELFEKAKQKNIIAVLDTGELMCPVLTLSPWNTDCS